MAGGRQLVDYVPVLGIGGGVSDAWMESGRGKSVEESLRRRTGRDRVCAAGVRTLRRRGAAGRGGADVARAFREGGVSVRSVAPEWELERPNEAAGASIDTVGRIVMPFVSGGGLGRVGAKEAVPDHRLKPVGVMPGARPRDAVHVGRDHGQTKRIVQPGPGSFRLAWLKIAQLLRITSKARTAAGDAPSGDNTGDFPEH